MSIADKILRLNEIKADIKQSIIDKGQVVDDDMSTYADAISNISGEVNNQDITVIKNGVYTAEEGYTGLGTVTVNVQGAETVINAINKTDNDINVNDTVWVNVSQPNFEKIGNPTITADFIASEFSISDYIDISSYDNYELYLKWDCTSSTQGALLSFDNGGNYWFGIFGGCFGGWMNDAITYTPVTIGKTYWYKIQCIGTSVTISYVIDENYVKGTDISNWNVLGTFTIVKRNVISLGVNFARASEYWYNNIYMTQALMLSDDVEVWRGVVELNPAEIVDESQKSEYSKLGTANENILVDEEGKVSISSSKLEFIEVNENGIYTPSEGYLGLGKVIVDVPQGIDPEGTFNIVKNGRYDIREYNEVDVNVETPSEEITVLNGTADNHEAGDFVFVRKGEGESVLSGDISYQGSDVIIDNNFIARNFTENSYLVVDNSVIRKNCEYNFKFTTGEDINSFQNVASIFPLFELYVENGRMLAWNESGENSPLYAGDVQSNATYYAKIIYSTNEENEDTLQLAYSTDGSDWQYSSTELTWCDNYEYFRLGWSVHGLGSRYWRGSIDLNEVYVSENGVKVWKAVSGGTEINIETIGSISIDNGIASGFSNDDYLKLPYVIPSSFSTMEIVVKFKASKIEGDDYPIINQLHAVRDIFVEGRSKKVCQWNGSECIRGQTIISEDSYYTLKITSNGVTNNIFVNNNLEFSTTSDIFKNVDLCFGGSAAHHQYFPGFIDLNDCYIKIDDVKVWKAIIGSEHKIVNKNEADDDTLYCKVLGRIDSGNKGLVAICNVKHKNLNINTNGTYSLDNALLRSVKVNVQGSSEDDGAYEAYTVLYNVVNSTDRNADHEVNEVISVLERI